MEPGLDGRPNGGGVGEFCPGRKGWKKAAEGGMPEAWEVVGVGRGVKSGKDGGAENSSPETRGFWVREREDTMDPDLA